MAGVSRRGRRYRGELADRNLAVRHFGWRWWRAYFADVAQHPFAKRCQVNPINRMTCCGPENRCHIVRLAGQKQHVHGTVKDIEQRRHVLETVAGHYRRRAGAE